MIFADRVRDFSSTTGTGNFTLLATPPAGYITFASAFGAAANEIPYCIEAVDASGNPTGDWEVGFGTLSGSTALARTTVLASSNAGALVNFSAGTKNVYCTIPAIQAGVPPGTVIENAGSATPFGYLPCDGAAVSRTTYLQLFTAISTAYGVGDGSTTFNVPDRRGRVGVGAGTGLVTETQPAANFNVSDVITVNSNPMDTKPKWLTGMKVQSTTSGVLPTGIAAATDHWVRRLSATTISLYASFAQAMNRNSTAGIRNITATGSGNHTLTCTMTARALADLFGAELTADVPDHYHSGHTGGGAANLGTTTFTAINGGFDTVGDTNGVTNMPPSIVMNYFIKY